MPRRHRLIALAVATASIGVPAAVAATVKTKVIDENPKVSVEDNESVFFNDGSDFSLTCKGRGQESIGFGIRDSGKHFVGASFGPQSVGAYAAGARGKATLHMQVLCADGAKVVKKYDEGPPTTGTSVATVNCGKKAYALGAALSSQFAPVFTKFASAPDKTGHKWIVNADVPSEFPVAQASPTRADVACVKAKSLKSYANVSKTITKLGPIDVSCTGGRTAIGWGVALSPVASGTDGFAIPLIRRAEFAGSKMHFDIALPIGAKASTTAVPQTVTVACGTWR